MQKLTYAIIARELVRLRHTWKGISEFRDFVQHEYDEAKETITLKLDNGNEETYSLGRFSQDTISLSLNDFSKVCLRPLLVEKFGPQKPTPHELLASAMELLGQLKSRLGEL